MMLLEKGDSDAVLALEKIDRIFNPAVSFRALTGAPLASQPGDDDWPDVAEVYAHLKAAAILIGGNSPEVTFEGGEIQTISYTSRTGSSVFRWQQGRTYGYYDVTCTERSSLLLRALDREDSTPVRTRATGVATVHKPGTHDNPGPDWAIVPDDGHSARLYPSKLDLVLAEASDWEAVGQL